MALRVRFRSSADRPKPTGFYAHIEVMNLALAEFARDVNPEAKKQIVLLVDRAGFHTSKAVQNFVLFASL